MLVTVLEYFMIWIIWIIFKKICVTIWCYISYIIIYLFRNYDNIVIFLIRDDNEDN